MGGSSPAALPTLRRSDRLLVGLRALRACRWPNVPRARDALLRLAESYKAIRYRDDLAETCTKLRQGYPGDIEVARVCGDVKTPDAPAVALPRPASSGG